MLREAELGIQTSQRRDVAAAVAEGSLVEDAGHVRAERHEVLAEPRRVLILLQLLAQGFSLNLVHVREDAVEGSEFHEQIARRLRANRRDAGHVVRRVTGESKPISDLRHGNAEALEHFRRAEDLVAHGVPHHDVVADELHQVLVGADDDHAPFAVPRLRNRGGDKIVRLEAVLLEDGDRECVHDLPAADHLLRQVRRGRGPVRFVLFVDLFSERARLRVHRDGEQRRSLLPHEPLEHVHRAEDGLRRFAGRRRERRDRVVRAEHISRQIHDVEDIGGAGFEERRRHLWVPALPRGAPISSCRFDASVSRSHRRMDPRSRGRPAAPHRVTAAQPNSCNWLKLRENLAKTSPCKKLHSNDTLRRGECY